MKYVCCKCLGLFSEKDIIRMPFNSDEEYWCKDCHKKWADDNPYRGSKVSEKKPKEKK